LSPGRFPTGPSKMHAAWPFHCSLILGGKHASVAIFWPGDRLCHRRRLLVRPFSSLWFLCMHSCLTIWSLASTAPAYPTKCLSQGPTCRLFVCSLLPAGLTRRVSSWRWDGPLVPIRQTMLGIPSSTDALSSLFSPPSPLTRLILQLTNPIAGHATLSYPSFSSWYRLPYYSFYTWPTLPSRSLVFCSLFPLTSAVRSFDLAVADLHLAFAGYMGLRLWTLCRVSRSLIHCSTVGTIYLAIWSYHPVLRRFVLYYSAGH
jgi:hypothetical protein